MELHEIKNFYTTKEIVTRLEAAHRIEENLYQLYIQ
jgi:hypothetical protein